MTNIAEAGATAHFGASVALASNGNDAAVGAPGQNGGDGAVFPYTYYGLDGQQWNAQTAIPSPSSHANFGASVDMSRIGSEIAVGAPQAGGGDGAAYVYRISGMQEAPFTDPSGATGGRFGASVSFARETLDQLLVGAPAENAGTGAAYDFDAAGGANWVTDGVALTPASPPVAGDAYGIAVAVSADASNALIGAPGAVAGDGSLTHFLSGDVSAPDPPIAVNAVVGAESATVSWSAGWSTGGAPITGFTVRSSPGGLTCQTAGLSCKVSGLTDGRTYTFTVTATNRAGTSAPSSPSGGVTPVGAGDGGGDGTPGGSDAGNIGGATGSGAPSAGGAIGSGVPSAGAATGGAPTPSPAPVAGGKGPPAAGGAGAHSDSSSSGAPPRPRGPLKLRARTRTSITISWSPGTAQATIPATGSTNTSAAPGSRSAL